MNRVIRIALSAFRPFSPRIEAPFSRIFLDFAVARSVYMKNEEKERVIIGKRAINITNKRYVKDFICVVFEFGMFSM
jgi:hypothetical protein